MTVGASDGRLQPESRRLGLGTVQFGLPYGISNAAGQVSRDTAKAIVDLAAASGMRWLDTAAAYGNAEEALAAILPPVNGFGIVTKTLRLAEGLEAVVARARQSAALLKSPDALLVIRPGTLPERAGRRSGAPCNGCVMRVCFAASGFRPMSPMTRSRLRSVSGRT